jgi:hypothetical protein
MKENYLNYRCPRWEDFPEIELYMDQVVSILEESLNIFSRNEKIITPAMINNYVKQKIVKPPNKKKYDRVHLAYLYVVCVLKRIMPISQICDGMAFAMKKYPIPVAYNKFCDELEWAIAKAFGENAELPDTECTEDEIIRSVANSYANLLYANYLINNMKTE